MKKWWALILVLLVIITDQVSKYWALEHLTDEYAKTICSVLDLRLALNHGVAFSLFYTKGIQTPMLLIGLTGLLSIFVLYLLIQARDNRHVFAYALILGGALANIWDRVRLGAVIDFIDVHIASYHWPIFNLADSFICIGAFILILYNHRSKT